MGPRTWEDSSVVPATLTRGHGFLEPFLARMRAERAGKGLGVSGGAILDIGCGTTPYFLLRAPFDRRHGMDRIVSPEQIDHYRSLGVELHAHDLQSQKPFPFPDDAFDAVTMLAVLEHIDPARLPHVIREIRRVLKSGGAFFLTTPASWTEPIVTVLTATNMLSKEEIDEHQPLFTKARIRGLLEEAGFRADRIRLGSFEWGLNLWARAVND